MKVIQSTNPDPFWNLALEAWLVEQDDISEATLLLWQGETSVVIGKNQNPWRECDLEVLKSMGGVLARRVSGGGAVYHDLGNLNYAVFIDRNRYQAALIYEAVQRALRTFDLNAEISGKSSLAIDGQKISGNAFAYKRHLVMHHGTLLVQSDLGNLKKVLIPPALDLTTKAIASVPAQVVNLSELNAALTIPSLSQALTDSFVLLFGDAHATDAIDKVAIQEKQSQMQTWDWIYGHTPPFEVTYEKNRLEFKKGKVAKIDQPIPAFQNLTSFLLRSDLL